MKVWLCFWFHYGCLVPTFYCCCAYFACSRYGAWFCAEFNSLHFLNVCTKCAYVLVVHSLIDFLNINYNVYKCGDFEYTGIQYVRLPFAGGNAHASVVLLPFFTDIVYLFCWNNLSPFAGIIYALNFLFVYIFVPVIGNNLILYRLKLENCS